MGLTIHYRLSYPAVSAEEAASAVERLRQSVLDLPFEEVGELRCFQGEGECDYERWRGTDYLWMLIQATRSLHLADSSSLRVKPVEVVAFEAWPGEECEPVEVGLARYPTFVDLGPRFHAELMYRTGNKRYP